MPANATDIVRRPDDLTAAWLSDVLGREIKDFRVTRIGTGQMSETYRVALDAEGEPGSVVLKVAASDPTSRATGVGLGAYEREIRFYREVAERVGGGAVVACHVALLDPTEGWFTLVLEDLDPAAQGDQIAGCSVESARLALRELALLQAPLLGDAQLAVAGWLNQDSPLGQGLLEQLWPGFLERYGERVAPEHRELCERFLPSLDAWAAERPGCGGLVHGDYRLDNLLFGTGEAARPFAVVDWQTVGWGPAMLDAAYFLGGSLPVEDRRAAEDELLREYHGLLPGDRVSWEECRHGYRHSSFAGVLMAVAASMLVERTERGDDMFLTSLARHAQQAIDLDAVALLPSRGPAGPPPRPEPDDENPHEPGPEQLWNESWYFDAADESGSLGAYVRLGLYPQLGIAWYTAFVVGPERESVGVFDLKAPLPEEGLALRTAAIDAEHRCEEPLGRFAVSLRGRGEAHADAAAFMRGEPGRSTSSSTSRGRRPASRTCTG